MEEFTRAIIEAIKQIPEGKVATYGQIAAMAGKPLGARQVAWVLHSFSRKENLPWQRVVGSRGRISLPEGGGLEEQRGLLLSEGVEVSKTGRLDLEVYRWRGVNR